MCPARCDEGRRKVLIVDDNPAIHEDFHRILCPDKTNCDIEALEASLFGGDAPDEAARGPEYELHGANQGQAALDLVKQAVRCANPYALVFMDVRMPPGWDGIRTLDEIWRVDPEVEAVLCTAYSDYSWQEIILKLRKHEQLLILKKPFDVVEVRQMSSALTEKCHLRRRTRATIHALEATVRERTRALEDANTRLRRETVARETAEAELRRAQADGDRVQRAVPGPTAAD